jgi:hypothetical protein
MWLEFADIREHARAVQILKDPGPEAVFDAFQGQGAFIMEGHATVRVQEMGTLPSQYLDRASDLRRNGTPYAVEQHLLETNAIFFNEKALDHVIVLGHRSTHLPWGADANSPDVNESRTNRQARLPVWNGLQRSRRPIERGAVVVILPDEPIGLNDGNPIPHRNRVKLVKIDRISIDGSIRRRHFVVHHTLPV